MITLLFTLAFAADTGVPKEAPAFVLPPPTPGEGREPEYELDAAALDRALQGVDGRPRIDPADLHELQGELAEKASWCRDEGRLLPSERAWCDLVPPDCPGLAKRCAAAKEEEAARAAASTSGRGCSDGESEPTRTPDLPDPVLPDRPVVAVDLSFLRPVVQGLAIALAVVAAISAVVAWVRARGAEPAAPPPRNDAPLPEPTLELPEVLPADPLEAARREAQAGRIGPALMLLRAVALEALSAAHLVTLDPSRTDREYLRAVRGLPEATPLRVLVEAIERFRYAQRPLDSAAFERALQATASLTRRTVVLFLIAVGVAAVAHAGPEDHDLLRDFVEARHIPLVEEEALLPDTLWIVPAEDEDQVERAVTAAAGGATVLLVGSGFSSLPEGVNLEFQDAKASVATDWCDLHGASIETPWVPAKIDASGHTLAVSADAHAVPVAVDIPHGEGRLVIVAIPGLLDDASLLRPQNAAFVAALLEWLPTEGGAFIHEAVRPASGSPGDALEAAGLSPVLLHGLVLVLAAAWWRGRSFAPPLDPPEAERRDYTEHLRAAAVLYRTHHGSHAALGHYAAWMLHRLRERTRVDDASLAEAVAVRSGLEHSHVERVLARARAAAGDPWAPMDPDDLTLQEDLWQISDRMK